MFSESFNFQVTSQAHYNITSCLLQSHFSENNFEIQFFLYGEATKSAV